MLHSAVSALGLRYLPLSHKKDARLIYYIGYVGETWKTI